MLNSLPPQSMKTPPFTVTHWRKGIESDSFLCIEDGGSALWAIGGTGDTIHIDENVNVAGGRNNLSFHTGIDSSQWNSIVVVWNGTQSASYVNGRLIWTNSLPSPGALSSTHRFYVGADPYAGFEYCNGQLDDIRIYNRALSSNEVAQLYATESQVSCSPHRATATATLDSGFVVGASIIESGCGYTNAPVVLIQGGGGNGATAIAVVNNGVVVIIIITDAGFGYTSPPQIIIGSPPFVPTVSIAVSAVKVTQHVVLGRNYVLESSADLVNWTATGPQFTAQAETIVSEFDVDVTGRYFRIRQVP